jgi:carbonic anhydrase/acetyltransferase-like protein (isoleucine patch superfamily)
MLDRETPTAYRTSWKIWNEVWRRLAWPRVRLAFALNGIAWGSDWRLYGAPIIQKHRDSRMQFGPGLSLRSSARSNPLSPNHPVVLATWQAGAVLEVGAQFAMTGGTLCAAERITIGDRVTVGANCTIVDTDFHPPEVALRQISPNGAETAPVAIEDNVFIGMNCLILKGVTIGRGSVVGAGSVVTRDAPPGVIIAGNPARVVRTLEG